MSSLSMQLLTTPTWAFVDLFCFPFVPALEVDPVSALDDNAAQSPDYLVAVTAAVECLFASQAVPQPRIVVLQTECTVLGQRV